MGFCDLRLSKGDIYLTAFLTACLWGKRPTFTKRLLMGEVVSVDRLKLTLVNQIHWPSIFFLSLEFFL